MSLRQNAPYRDHVEEDGTILVYQGHDVSRSDLHPYPKLVDQPEFTPSGNRTENGKFHKSAQDYRQGLRPPEKVKVYEKIRDGIWSFNGFFHLIDSWQETEDNRIVFKFKLEAVEEEINYSSDLTLISSPHRRIIPTSVKLEVWKRDGGKCAICGVTNELHFDHIIPYSKGGTSLNAANIQLLCIRHNLEKRDKIA